MDNKKLFFLIVFISCLIYNHSSAQSTSGTENILVKPFQFFGDDSSKMELRTKFPKLVLYGIATSSSLRYIAGDDHIDEIKYGVKKWDSVFLSNNKKLIDSARIRFYMEGELRVLNKKFSSSITLRRKDQIVGEFESPPRPFTDMQFIIDSACNYFNYRVQNSTASNAVLRVSVRNFKMINDVPGTSNTFDPEFPSRYLATKLKNASSYLLLPLNDSSKADIVITGTVKYGTREFCSINTVIYLNNATPVGLQKITGYLKEKEKLLLNTLNNVQSSLNAIVIPENLGEVREFITQNNHSQQDYINAFDDAFKAGKLALAYFYADGLSEHFKEVKNNSELLKSKIYLAQGNLYDGLNNLSKYASDNPNDIDAKYYLGIGFLNNRQYKQARNILLGLTGGIEKFHDLYYQVGLSFFREGINQSALDYFQKQMNFDPMANKETRLYLAYCYSNMKNWNEGLSNIDKYYLTDTLKNKNATNDYLLDCAKHFVSVKNYKRAYQLFGTAYDLINKKYTILAQLRSASYIDSSTIRVRDLITKGLQKGFFDKRYIYLDIAAFYDVTAFSDSAFVYDPNRVQQAIDYTLYDTKINQKDPLFLSGYLGEQYYKLGKLDSALYYYKKTNGADGYLNIAELYLSKGDAVTSLKFLKKTNDAYKLTTNKLLEKAIDKQIALYYYYMIASKIITNEDFSTELGGMNAILDRYSDPNLPLLEDWEFQTYYISIKNNTQLTQVIKSKMISYLCPLIAVSYNKILPCQLKMK